MSDSTQLAMQLKILGLQKGNGTKDNQPVDKGPASGVKFIQLAGPYPDVFILPQVRGIHSERIYDKHMLPGRRYRRKGFLCYVVFGKVFIDLPETGIVLSDGNEEEFILVPELRPGQAVEVLRLTLTNKIKRSAGIIDVC